MNRLKILVRKNLKMSEGKIAAQCIHGALGLQLVLFLGFHWIKSALLFAKSVVVLQVSDAKFEEAKTSLAAEKNTFHVVHDAGYTEIEAGTETVLAFLERDPRQ